MYSASVDENAIVSNS